MEFNYLEADREHRERERERWMKSREGVMRRSSRVFERIVLRKMDFYGGRNVARIWERIAVVVA